MRGMLLVAAIVALVLGVAAHQGESLQRVRPDVHWDKQTISGDFNCDGRKDHAALGHQPGKVFVGIVLSDGTQPHILEFAVHRGENAAVCSPAAVLRKESLDYDPKETVGELEGFHQTKDCWGLQLEDDECDSIHFYWNTVTRQVAWWRL